MILQVGDWVMARPEFVGDDDPSLPWVVGQLVRIDQNDPVPWLVRIGSQTPHWRITDAVRLPETDEEWAAVAAFRLIEGV